jgi:pimeloyl-ACP methyl ester carboxylesterase
MCAVRELAHLRTALFLHGTGTLIGVARRLHRVTLGDRPFVSLSRSECGEQGLDRACNGTLCLDAHELPRDMHAVLANLGAPDLRVRLVACADSAEPVAELTMISRIVTISIPPLSERSDELERLLEAYGWDAVKELGATCPGFQPGDSEWLRDSEIATLDEIEDAARRLVALRNWGVTEGAKRIGIAHSSLSRWAHRRKIST